MPSPSPPELVPPAPPLAPELPAVALPPFLRALGRRLIAEGDRWLLWLPVLLGCGIALYFALPAQPPRITLVIAAATAVLATPFAARQRKRRPLLAGAAGALAATAVGWAVAGLRTDLVAAPVLPRAASYHVEGRVVKVAAAVKGHRLVLDALALGRVRPETTPERLRVTVRYGAEELAPGDRVRLRAHLEPPGGPALPGGFDYGRYAYFDRLGAVGYAFGRPELLAKGAPDAWSLWLSDLRERIARRIIAAAPGPSGAVAAALITNARAGIDAATWRHMQRSGLAHLISISGLHMALVAGTLYLAARYALALIPFLALRWPVKKPAAVVAMVGAFFYLLLAGASVPTLRSFLMVEVGLLAILLGRRPLSMRLLAWAAVVVLLLEPESLLGVSFQLSFAAVLALTAVYESGLVQRLSLSMAGRGRAWLALHYVLGVTLTTVIASVATSPLTAYHFQTIATYGVLANAIAVPLTSFWVMPAGLLGLALIPLGLDRPVFALMAEGVEVVLLTAHVVAEMPGASLQVTQWPGEVLVLFAAGGLWLALWRRPWRFWGLAPVAAALALVLTLRPPDLLVDPELDAAAWRLPSGEVAVQSWRADKRLAESWLEALGVEAAAVPPGPGAAPAAGLACDPAGCVLTRQGRRVALARRLDAVLEDCASADLVLSRVGPERCAGGARLIGPRALVASGGVALWLQADGITVRTVQDSRGRWPWSARR